MCKVAKGKGKNPQQKLKRPENELRNRRTDRQTGFQNYDLYQGWYLHK